MFSDLNNLNVITTTSEEYANYFGFTETEVFKSMEEFGLADKEGVKKWCRTGLMQMARITTDLKATVQAALQQIEEKKYEQALLDLGIEKEHIRKYGFAFEGNKALIG